jgi:cation diffusion facilitator family transporter
MDSIQALYQQGRKAARWGLAVSLCLGLGKLVGGVWGHSFALVTDAVHSLVDAVLSGVLVAALTVAQRPADSEHPYGHSRIEAVAATCIAMLLMLLALAIAVEAISSIGWHREPPETFTLVIAGASALISEGLFHYVSRVARKTRSGALQATAWDYRLDAMGSLVVLAGVAIAKWGGPDWHWADHVAAIAVAATILWVGGGLFWDNVQSLIDRQAGPDLLDAVTREALAVPGVLGVETLRIRKAGLEYLVDIHIEVDPDESVRAGHATAHAVKDRVIRHVDAIRDVLVHIEPADSVPASQYRASQPFDAGDE